jgi:hypothetical protein
MNDLSLLGTQDGLMIERPSGMSGTSYQRALPAPQGNLEGQASQVGTAIAEQGELCSAVRRKVRKVEIFACSQEGR